MIVQFTKQDLDYLAEKIAERLKGEVKQQELANPFDDMTIQEVLNNDYAKISIRLYTVLTNEFPGWTMKQLAGVKWRDYKRVRGLGVKTYNELCFFFEKLNYTPGWNRLMYYHKSKSYVIIER